MSSRSPRPRALTEVSAADWVVERVGEFGSRVRGLLPSGFESYVRVLHPAWPTSAGAPDDREPLPWEAVAAITGARMHACVQFDALVGADRGEARDFEPAVGELPPTLVSALCEVLGKHTATPERCWFCLWDGYGWIAGSSSAAVLITTGAAPGRAVDTPPAFPAEIMSGPRVSLPGRDYILFEGPLAAAKELGWRRGELLSDAYPELDFDPADFEPQSPNLFWPHDHSWCVATEIDLDSTYVGGPQGLVDALVDDPRFEAWPAQLDDRVDAGGDEINT
jgi:hypothetical protein